MRGVIALPTLAVLLSGASGAPAQSPIVDGQIVEWNASTLIAADPLGDADSVFDLTEVHAASRGSRLFISFDTTTTLNLQSGPSGEGTLKIHLTFSDDQQLTIDLRNRLATWGGDPPNPLVWSALQYASMTTYAGNRFELRVDVGALGFGQDDIVSVDFSGSDVLDAPASFVLEQPAEAVVRRAPQRQPCTAFRIANLNTLFGGLFDSERGPAIGRLVQAAAADIYCFQEQDSPVNVVANRLAELDPLNNGADWNVHKSSDTLIASPQPLIGVPHSGDAAAVVDLGSLGAVVVFSIHPPCCGYIGSGQDNARISEMQSVVATIAQLRSAALGPALEPYRYAPVIVVGDWNLVGSRTPLDLLEDPQGPNLTHWLLPHLIGDDVFTWRDLNESPGDFSPGLLDLLAYRAGLLFPRMGFVLDSTELNDQELLDLGLLSDDSRASDHLMLVGDFAATTGGDLDGDGIVGPVDLAQLLGTWGDCVLCPADLNVDGRVNAADLAQLIGGWGPCE